MRFLLPTFILAACDLQPRILSLPDTVGEFISARYPALLADPETQPEIYNSAATDYGVYASPELYGSVGTDDYILYASVNDYVLAPTPDDAGVAGDADTGAPIVPDTPSVGENNDYLVVPMYGVPPASDSGIITVGRGDTLYAIARRTGMSVDELATLNKLAAPYTLRVGQKLKTRSENSVARDDVLAVPQRLVSKRPSPTSVPAQTTTVVELKEITVGAGDTLYSLSRRYAIPVNDLAVMNKLSAPFALRVGQKLRVPNLGDVAVRTPTGKTVKPAANARPIASASIPDKKPGAGDAAKKTPSPAPGATTTPVAKPKQVISSDPTKKLPTLTARSSSKFSWPVRGTILSHFGAKNGGLFNDGINISASQGTPVRAAENGVVAYAGNEVKGMGNLVIIQHSGGWMTVYAHMDSIDVRRGTRVSVGQKVGAVGTSGKVTKPQLHFEIRKGTKAYNPSTYLK